MNAQPITPVAPSVPAVRRSRTRTAALAACVAAVVAAGAYTATEALDRGTATRDAAPVTVPSESTAAVQQLRDSLEQQYGSNPAAMATLLRRAAAQDPRQPRRPVRRDRRGVIDALPGGAAARSATASPASTAGPPRRRRALATGELREIRDSLAAQYGDR